MTPGAIPALVALADGEIAVNAKDRVIYIRFGDEVIAIARYDIPGDTGKVSPAARSYFYAGF